MPKTPKNYAFYIKMFVRACVYEKKVVSLFPKRVRYKILFSKFTGLEYGLLDYLTAHPNETDDASFQALNGL